MEGTNPETLTGLLEDATRLAHGNDWPAAQGLCKRILDIDSNNELGLYLISISYIRLNNNDNAIKYLKKLVSIDKNDVNKFSLLTGLLCAAGRNEEALPYLRRAAVLAPSPATLNSLGAVCADAGLLGEAIAAFRQSLTLQPEDNVASAGLYPLLRLACDWTDELDVLSRQIDTLNAAALAAGEVVPEPPFDNVHRIDDPSANLAVAASWSRMLSDEAARSAPVSISPKPRPGDGRLRIGYLSGDFHDHAIAHLTRGLYGHHDRSRFAIHAYSYGPDDDSLYRRQIREACDTFTDLTETDDREAACRIAEDGIDIMVDLKSYTRRHRLAICALHPAPVQVTYLGFPGTTGADFFDYAITDATVTPLEVAEYYRERLVYMPRAYQCNDDSQEIPDIPHGRKEIFGGKDYFIFCSFNNPIKLDPVFFDIWMDILHQTPDSLLWILQNNALAQRNLLRRAESAGIRPDRIRFAEMLPRDRHLSRMALADLALDTRIYNGHTTTSDALWAGLPVITMMGKHFASRVSASLLRAMNLPELVTTTPESYRELALHYARHPDALATLKDKVAANRRDASLFDTAKFTRNLETAYEYMWKRHLDGEAPRGFAVPDT